MNTPVTASCHCGAVELSAILPNGLKNPSRCTCSFCARRQAANVTALATSVKVLKGADNLTLYSWNTHTAKHYFCKTCGIYTHHQRRADPSQSGINLGCIHGAQPWDHEPIPWTDGINHPSDR
ncbi:CRISPR-associated protein Cas8b1/Cst1, subtype I-B/TNEAP [Sulfitobacter brevis]|uniref:CRISPR-associated protein Cas8b1/Cst1, subtype I-B/TNEAP n=1 Tax=Sulfitobacter brevis TaxID=74348 RepID=A0A1I2AGQ1_9RHOB|nr:GFA family protein [Sulfitobacter brevis]SFE42163.1 CRISPR-associated protein Cas8b1/Cst1, subtype I-B/TNEAP [Sulfitobacter brevis]